MSAEIAITMFFLAGTALFFIMPSLLKKVSDNQIVDLLIKRCFYIIGFYLMVMNSGITAEIASTAGYSTKEIFRYLWIFGQAGYLLMFATFLKTFFDIVLLTNKQAKEKRGL